MATYSLAQAIGGFIRHMCNDGSGNFYVVTGGAVFGVNWTVYMWDRTVLTDISANTFQVHLGMTVKELEWFNGSLYVLSRPVNGTLAVYRWDGLGTTTWTLVDSVGGLVWDANGGYLCADGSRIVWIGAEPVFRASTDGAVWGNQTLAGGYSPLVPVNCGDEGHLVVSGWSGLNRKCFEYAAPNWSPITPALVTYEFIGSAKGYQYWDDNSGIAATALHYSTDWATLANWPLNYTVYFIKVFERGGFGVFLAPDFTTWPRRVYLWNTVTLTWDLDGSIGSNVETSDPCVFAGDLYILGWSGIYIRDTPLVALPFSPGSTKSIQGLLDVDEDDDYLYVATLLSGVPELLRLPTDLLSDPTAVYVPGAGTDINVKCGSKDADWVWISGDFAGDNKVCVSINDGGAWTVKLAPAGVGVAIPLVVGPDDDNAVLVPTDTTDDLYATVNGGLSWTTPNVNLPFNVGAMDVLDLNPSEIMVGDRAAADVRYSPNGGVSFHDISFGLPAGKPVRDLIIG